MDESLSVRQVYFYKKRNKYLTKTMEEFIRVAVGDEGFQKVREAREKENQEKKNQEKINQEKKNQEKKNQEKRNGTKNAGGI